MFVDWFGYVDMKETKEIFCDVLDSPYSSSFQATIGKGKYLSRTLAGFARQVGPVFKLRWVQKLSEKIT